MPSNERPTAGSLFRGQISTGGRDGGEATSLPTLSRRWIVTTNSNAQISSTYHSVIFTTKKYDR